MNEIPYTVHINKTAYENITAACPCCGKESIFNRATDLGVLTPIAFRAVFCLNPSCGKPFNIKGDCVNSVSEMLIFDCDELLEQKHYRYCVLSLAQAYEVFFSLFLRVEFLYKPYAADPNENAVKLHNFNRLAKQLSKKVEKYAFPKMRKLFLWQIVSGCSPLTLADAEAAIGKLKVRKDCPNDADLESLSDKELMPILKAIRDTQIDKLRNKVVHKQAYRPTWEEVESALDECRKLLPPLTWHLGLHDDPGWYVGENLAGR